MQADAKPNYYKLYLNLWQSVADLPKPQGAKLLYAMARLFFDNVEPAEGELPKDARRIYLAKRHDLLSYRRNVINGMKNTGKNRAKKRAETDAETDAETTSKTRSGNGTGFSASADAVPADMLEVGTYPEAHPRPIPNHVPAVVAMGATNSKQETISGARGATHAPRAARAAGSKPMNTSSSMTLDEYRALPASVTRGGVDGL